MRQILQKIDNLHKISNLTSLLLLCANVLYFFLFCFRKLCVEVHQVCIISFIDETWKRFHNAWCNVSIMERKDRNTYMTNYVRLCFVAQYENRNLLEELLKNQISLGHKLQLKRIHSVFFNYEEGVFIRECIEQNCFEKLNLRLLYLLIRNLQLVQPPSRRWSSNSYPKVLTIEDGVELIYQKYNLILHSGKTSFTNEEVRELFSIFNDIAITFDHFCMNNTGNKSVTRYIETCCVDYKMRSRYRNHLHVLEMNLKETKG